MPKQKTHSGAKKKFKVTGTGKLLRRRARCRQLWSTSRRSRSAQFSKDQPVDGGERRRPSTACSGGANRCLASSAPSTRARSAARFSSEAKGYWGLKSTQLQVREGAGRALARLRLPRPQGPEARVPPALDHAHQRGRARERALVQPVHRGPEGRERRARPEGARRPRRQRPGRVRRDRRAGQGGARRVSARSRQRRDLLAAGRRTATAARRSTPSSVAGSRTIRGSATSLPISTWDFAAAAARGAALPGARRPRRRGTTSSGALDAAAEFLRAVRRRAGRADERGAALLGAPAGLPHGRRRAAVRPARARPVAQGSTSSGTATATATRTGTWGERRARARRRRPRPAAGRAARARASRSRGGAGSTSARST